MDFVREGKIVWAPIVLPEGSESIATPLGTAISDNKNSAETNNFVPKGLIAIIFRSLLSYSELKQEHDYHD